MKTIVAHIGPDLDAIAAIWLIKKYFQGWEEAVLAFVPAGKTLKDLPPDDNPEVIHVDTGFGKFDHHQSDADTCASRLVYEEIAKNRGEDTALDRLTNIINDVDHFREAFFPNPTSDYWDLSIVAAIDGWRLIYSEDPLKIVTLGMDNLDGIYKIFQNKVWAEKEIKEKAVEFETKWGKAIGLETTNDEVVHLGQKMGYSLVVRKDPKKGYLRIKALPKDNVDLTALYGVLSKAEPNATWFLHASKKMILNGTSKNPEMKPSARPLSEIIETIKSIK